MTDILLENGDVKRGADGYPRAVTGVEALIQRAMVRLSVRRGSFAPDPELGGLLHTLAAAPPGQQNALALSLARQALSALPQVLVESAECRREGEALRLTFGLRVGEQTKTLEVYTG